MPSAWQRNQLRVMIRSEAVIVSCLGALLGFAVAVSFGCVLVLSLGDLGVTELRIPLGQLLALVVVTALAGLRPAFSPPVGQPNSTSFGPSAKERGEP